MTAEPTLASQLDAFRAEFVGKVPMGIREAMMRADAKLAASDIVAGAKREGDPAPGFVLPDHRGTDISLGELLAQGPVVLSFYRGGWCPYCNLELHALQQALPEIEALGASLVAISPQTPDASLSTAEKNELAFRVLSDVGSVVAKAYGIAFDLADALRPIYAQLGHALPDSNGTDDWVLPLPATYLVDRDGTIRLAYVETDYRRRLEPSRVIEALGELAR